MTAPDWVTADLVVYILDLLLDMGGGLHGLRDPGLLDSALARPRNLQAHGETDLFQLAACYAEAIARNHAFLDGNKRTAFYVAVEFLERNGQELLPAKGHEHADMIEQLAQGNIPRESAGHAFAPQRAAPGLSIPASTCR